MRQHLFCKSTLFGLLPHASINTEVHVFFNIFSLPDKHDLVAIWVFLSRYPPNDRSFQQFAGRATQNRRLLATVEFCHHSAQRDHGGPPSIPASTIHATTAESNYVRRSIVPTRPTSATGLTIGTIAPDLALGKSAVFFPNARSTGNRTQRKISKNMSGVEPITAMLYYLK
ncbi:uncharacterized protein BO72DRAFT_119912 [Aspergillus fijiensis CBS 313.89]|uniref:Uncharacterized protein n=1 Tax=Aspergillus fijiensis CBS 313.89 TaxID=1448319 RepID=A0A8G1VZ74_9EURO|nr:uncharacterized protein BO72DRAFT_119912 [Aspergillus fijiensis CBS 313.89]RAK77056.1 hypothetical protein BO72DRAFT_119912 [Aspergillus fijiensis CBS 313.89]